MKTPQQSYPDLAKTLGVRELYLKREDLHPYGSHKGRSIPLMMKEYIKQGYRHFVISSSGNAAKAAAMFVDKYYQNNKKDDIFLTIFVGKRIDPKKYRTISTLAKTNSKITVIQTERPKQAAFLEEKKEGIVNLRQSTDDMALTGYTELAEELSRLPNLKAVFIPTSSGTTALALANVFQALGKNIQIHIVQTSVCHPLAEVFDTDFKPEEKSLAGAIVDNVVHRKSAVINAVQTSHGSGWVIENNDISDAIQITQKMTHLTLSANSALCIAGIKKAVLHGWQWDGEIVALITGQ